MDPAEPQQRRLVHHRGLLATVALTLSAPVLSQTELVERTLLAECERLRVGREWPDDVGEYVDGHPGSDCEGGLTDPRVGVWADGGRTEEEPRVSVDDEPQHAAGRVATFGYRDAQASSAGR